MEIRTIFIVKMADVCLDVDQISDLLLIQLELFLAIVKRDTDTAAPYDHLSHRSVMDETYQNSFLIDGTADISLWAFIPVRLMYKRPEGTTFNCKPIHNGHVEIGGMICIWPTIHLK